MSRGLDFGIQRVLKVDTINMKISELLRIISFTLIAFSHVPNNDFVGTLSSASDTG